MRKEDPTTPSVDDKTSAPDGVTWKLGRTDKALKIVEGLIGHLDPPPDEILPYADNGVSIRWSPKIDDETARVSVDVFGEGVVCIGWMMSDGCRNDDWTLANGVSADVVSMMVKGLLEVVCLIDAVDSAMELAQHLAFGPPDLTAEELEYGVELAKTIDSELGDPS